MLASKLQPVRPPTPPPAPVSPAANTPAVPPVSESPKVAEVRNVVEPVAKASPTAAPPPLPPKVEKPVVTDSGKESVVTPPKPLRDLGRGGETHKAIQERIQTEAHALGFFAAVESQLAEKSNQAADVVLRRGELSIAVEISVTTTTDHEFGNVAKCVAAGFNRVAVLSPSREKLQAIAAAVDAGLDAKQRTHISYHTPDEFIAELRKLAESTAVAAPATATERSTRGYKVRRHGPSVSSEERKATEEAAIRLIAETMKRKP